jgi:site-specific recombinase XerC
MSSKPLRECLPSKEREEYVSRLRRRYLSHVAERQANRYIDEFLRFQGSVNRPNLPDLSPNDMLAYAKHLERSNRTFATARTKLTIALRWCRWLFEIGRVQSDVTEGFRASEMLSKMRKRS